MCDFYVTAGLYTFKTQTMKFWLITLLLSGSIVSVAQQSVPVFKTNADSLEFAKIQSSIQEIFKRERTAQSARQLDSLFKLQMVFRDKIIGYKTIFTTDKAFTKYDDLTASKVSPESVIKLSLNDVNRIPKNVITCTNLQELELVNTSIKKLPKKLNKLKHLKSIYVYNNESRGALKLAKNTITKELLLRGMVEKSLPKSYRKFSALEELDLSRNIGLTRFPDIYKNKNLKKLNLIENTVTLTDLKSIPNTSLTELNLQKNKIQKVPEAIGSFSSLKKLTFNYNQITEVSNAVGSLKNLEELSFYHNKLTAIPAGIYELPSLKAVDLYYNEIERLDPAIEKLQSLEILYLSNNKLVAVDDHIGKLNNLRELYLSNNRLFMLPGSLSALKKLTILRINENKLTDFPEFVFNLPAIENIDVSANSIRIIPEKVTSISTLNLFAVSDNPVNKEDVNMAKIIDDLRARGTIVHQNIIEQKVVDNP